jgi:hypothetical protein
MKDASIKKVSAFLGISLDEAEKFIEKSTVSGEITTAFPIDDWIEQRLLPNTIFIDEAGYSQMCIDALKILKTTAATDYGSSRQRDMGQLWADMTRGYLGEFAVKQLLKQKYNVDVVLGHEVGTVEEYLPSDIYKVREGTLERDPKINIGMKAAKLNGVWFDIPGAQFQKSHAHILVKVGTGRDHLFAFFKSISVFRDKVLKKGTENGFISEVESQEIWDLLPTFTKIPAYVVGFAEVNKNYQPLSYGGKKGRTNYNITSWNGPISPGDVDQVKVAESAAKVKFEGIGEFSHDSGYLFSTGKLIWNETAWRALAGKI